MPDNDVRKNVSIFICGHLRLLKKAAGRAQSIKYHCGQVINHPSFGNQFSLPFIQNPLSRTLEGLFLYLNLSRFLTQNFGKFYFFGVVQNSSKQKILLATDILGKQKIIDACHLFLSLEIVAVVYWVSEGG